MNPISIETGMRLEEVVEKTIEEYNKYRRTVAEAKLLNINGDEVLLEISGTLCHTCGFVDYLEDFIYEMERVTSDYVASLKNYEQIGDNKFIVKYKIEKTKS
ncbi:MAG: hypothetical protein LZ172_05845 [Thaumarchaeota archaeon]|jgi:hypothetical protein|nr:hypothetical protein [Candidatus Geocrenenecus arthurdayi]MCL7389563.1 hypothetical protein [Candidatus Geocrenenecus arthurdayi]MCL7391574.1 hypothetical protein [Candidatus Geocrenenecus arthurdayi]MCL7397095.1 hypothetical protein [Candidatus Geocrenenecus arthurdayi]MCL7403848.1 hypothetical protein [Candidatus Geocrenenecus arthurdayi]